MTIKPLIKAIAALAVSGMMLNASANSVGLDQNEYNGSSGSISVTLTYDFTEFAMFGGAVDITYDTTALRFISYTQADFSMSDAELGDFSPVGSLEAPGAYIGAGVGTSAFLVGMNDAGDFGTFVFEFLSLGDPSSTSCGMTICIEPNARNVLVDLDGGGDVSALLIANGNGGANVVVPVPAAVWFMLSGLGALLGFGRKSA